MGGKDQMADKKGAVGGGVCGCVRTNNVISMCLLEYRMQWFIKMLLFVIQK